MTYLKQILVELRKIHCRLDEIERKQNQNHTQLPTLNYPLSFLLEMPDNLRKTFIAVALSSEECTAEEVSVKTGRNRAVECTHLNLLHKQGYLTKTKHGKAYFFRTTENLMEVIKCENQQ